MENTTARIAQATELGYIAFASGRSRVPACDSSLMQLLIGLPIGGGSSEIMQAWITAWDISNLSNTVPS